MKWNKLGQIYYCKPIDYFLQTHAANPLAIFLKDDVYRVFFSGRSKENKSSVGYVDIDIIKKEIITVCNKSIFTYGDNNSFFSHGVSIGNMHQINSKKYIQFMAWQIRNEVHWRGDIGRLRMSDDNYTLKLEPNEVFIGCDEEDKVSLSYSWIMKDQEVYKMWYGSTISWTSENSEMVHVIKYATSKDGEKWEKHGLAIPYELGVAQAFSRPTVVKDKQEYHMWFSYRSGNGGEYRIGYAYSADGKIWDRKNNSGIDVSKSGWDSKMICYPFVFDHKGKRYMLYNGNDYGKNGFGLAVLEYK